MKAGRFKRLLNVKSFISADTLGRALNEADARLLREYNGEVIRKARHNKVFGTGTVDGWMVAALDGTQTHATQRPPNAAHKGWKRRNLNNGVTEYYEMAVGLSYVGSGPPLALSIGRLRRGEGEATAGVRLVKELDEQLGCSWCDAVCVDALFASARFINEMRARHKHVIVRAKNNLLIVEDAQGLFEQRPPDVRMQDDQDGITSWESAKEPLRCLKVRQVREDRRDANGSQRSRRSRLSSRRSHRSR